MEECSICMDNLDNGKQICITKCKHKFHCDCINADFASGRKEDNQYQCPMCRKDLDKEDIYKIIQKKQLLTREQIQSMWDEYIEDNENINCEDFKDELRIQYPIHNINESVIDQICSSAKGKNRRKNTRRNSRKQNKGNSRRQNKGNSKKYNKNSKKYNKNGKKYN